MKKLLSIIAVVSILTFSFVGCGSKVNYIGVSADEAAYDTAQELVEKSDCIVIGKIKEVSFIGVKRGLTEYQKSTLPEKFDNVNRTKYVIEIIEAYKGDPGETVTVYSGYGIKDYKVDEQMKANRDNDAIEDIFIDDNKPDGLGKEGDIYLFILNKSNRDIDQGEDAYFAHCMVQNSYHLDEPEKEDIFGVSLKEIIDTFGENEYTAFVEEYSKK